MDQVSRPVLIALLGTLLFACAWMTVLRPQPALQGSAAPAPPTAAPAASAAPARVREVVGEALVGHRLGV